MNVNQSDKTNFTGDPLKRIIRRIIVISKDQQIKLVTLSL